MKHGYFYSEAETVLAAAVRKCLMGARRNVIPMISTTAPSIGRIHASHVKGRPANGEAITKIPESMSKVLRDMPEL